VNLCPPLPDASSNRDSRPVPQRRHVQKPRRLLAPWDGGILPDGVNNAVFCASPPRSRFEMPAVRSDSDSSTRAHARRAFCWALVALALTPRWALAETPPALARFAGTFKYPDKSQGVAIVDKAVDEGLSDLNMVQRLIIKKFLAAHFVELIV